MDPLMYSNPTLANATHTRRCATRSADGSFAPACASPLPHDRHAHSPVCHACKVCWTLCDENELKSHILRSSNAKRKMGVLKNDGLDRNKQTLESVFAWTVAHVQNTYVCCQAGVVASQWDDEWMNRHCFERAPGNIPHTSTLHCNADQTRHRPHWNSVRSADAVWHTRATQRVRHHDLPLASGTSLRTSSSPFGKGAGSGAHRRLNPSASLFDAPGMCDAICGL